MDSGARVVAFGSPGSSPSRRATGDMHQDPVDPLSLVAWVAIMGFALYGYFVANERTNGRLEYLGKAVFGLAILLFLARLAYAFVRHRFGG